MVFGLTLIGTIIFCFVLHDPIKKYPLAFYGLVIVLDLLYIWGMTIGLPHAIWRLLFLLIHKCTLSLAIFVVVMFVSCLNPKGKPYLWLKAIRAELSIMAWFLSLGHMCVYLMAYVPRLGGAIKTNVVVAFVLAAVLFVLLMLLGITSFKSIKKLMKNESWIKLQKLAYPFFGLVYFHVMLMLAPSAMHGGKAAIVSCCVYTVVFGAYAIMRPLRGSLNKKAAAELAEAK